MTSVSFTGSDAPNLGDGQVNVESGPCLVGIGTWFGARRFVVQTFDAEAKSLTRSVPTARIR
ncbi:hypothetical protein SBBP2_1620002 [Burkholderiales bacterium]|nr:hypothetical protein SBBP2_1620002 [Burkholderiales bacterium]